MLTQSDSFTKVFVATTAVLVPALLAGTIALYLSAVLGFITARLLIRLARQTRADERAFIRRARHQLRTPLTGLNTRLQLLERADGMGAVVAELRHDTDLLIEAVDEVLRDSDPRPPRTHFKP
ncbi:histidine kinase dimerization/phospho-acceptor domain-containing protein [Leifsonia sp. NPDC014704]|uniref:histidine kinase dimerization/phospho-acceptor domain-containing protein n=1 Tax=Leifsonia sp. NPDC014704 TaxID=3364123 RepID=UPI0011C3610A